MAYAVATDVQARIPGRIISTTSKPSTTQVEAWIAEADAMLSGSLAAGGIPLPEVATNGATIMRAWECDYAEGRARMAYASAGGDGANDDGKDMIESFKTLLTNIRRYPSDYGSMLSAGGDAPEGTSKCRGSNADTSADNYIAPEFERSEVW
jgi:hypothetical protein